MVSEARVLAPSKGPAAVSPRSFGERLIGKRLWHEQEDAFLAAQQYLVIAPVFPTQFAPYLFPDWSSGVGRELTQIGAARQGVLKVVSGLKGLGPTKGYQNLLFGRLPSAAALNKMGPYERFWDPLVGPVLLRKFFADKGAVLLGSDLAIWTAKMVGDFVPPAWVQLGVGIGLRIEAGGVVNLGLYVGHRRGVKRRAIALGILRQFGPLIGWLQRQFGSEKVRVTWVWPLWRRDQSRGSISVRTVLPVQMLGVFKAMSQAPLEVPGGGSAGSVLGASEQAHLFIHGAHACMPHTWKVRRVSGDGFADKAIPIREFDL